MGKAKRIKKIRKEDKSKHTVETSINPSSESLNRITYEDTNLQLDHIKIKKNVSNSTVTKKKDKRKQKRNKLLDRLKKSKELKQEVISAKLRAKTAIIGDVQPLKDALPDVSTLLEQNSSRSLGSKEQPPSTKKRKSQKTIRKMELEDMKTFNKVLELPAYKADPVGAIKDHIEFLVGSDQF